MRSYAPSSPAEDRSPTGAYSALARKPSAIRLPAPEIGVGRHGSCERGPQSCPQASGRCINGVNEPG